MALTSRVKLSQSEVSQTFDLSEVYGREPTTQEISNFIDLAKERIIERSQSGVDVNGNEFKRYTEDYADQKGVPRGDVDMTLFGDMLLSIDGEPTGNGVKIMIDGDEAPKAYGHMTGFKGHPTIPNGKYTRKFFGLTRDEAEAIANAVQESRASFFEDLDIGAIVRAIGLVADGS